MSLKAQISQAYFPKFAEKVSTIGIDYDFPPKEAFTRKNKEKINDLCVIASRFGKVGLRPSRKGWHLKIRLWEPVTVKRSFEIRYFMQDDYHRLLRDMIKAMNGARTIDVLFDLKIKKRRSILE